LVRIFDYIDDSRERPQLRFLNREGKGFEITQGLAGEPTSEEGCQMNISLDEPELRDDLIAVYGLDAGQPRDPVVVANLIARHTYPGTGIHVAGDSERGREMYSGRIVGISELPSEQNRLSAGNEMHFFELRVAFPLRSLERSLAMTLTATCGEVLAYGGLRLLNLELPRAYTRDFKGPKFGVEGLRNILGVRGRPFLLGICKPSVGITPEQGAANFREAAIGGADIIKDDELLSDPHYSRRTKRVRLYLEAERQAFEATGEHTLYAVNITGEVNQLLANAVEAIDLGASALMLNYLQVGLDSTRLVCEDERVTVPVLGHNAGASSFYGAPGSGVSMSLINGRLPRLCGLDLCILLTQHGKFASSKRECMRTADEMRRPFNGLRPMLPVAAGGVVPGSVGMLYSEYGSDCALGSGGGIFGHPAGPRAGALAFRQAIIAAIQGVDIREASSQSTELRLAVESWGPKKDDIAP
jgi:2,3-diketo-5-methylthiopentyl-1-phosphate enolase